MVKLKPNKLNKLQEAKKQVMSNDLSFVFLFNLMMAVETLCIP